MKYDALHNRAFLETMFNPDNERGKPEKSSLLPNVASTHTHSTHREGTAQSNKDTTGGKKEAPALPKLRDLYRLAKVLFEYVLLWDALMQFCESAGVWD